MTHSYPGPSGTFPQLSLKPSYPRNLVLNPPSRNLQDLCWNFAWKLIWNLLWHLPEILLQFPKRCSNNVFFVREGIIQNYPQYLTGRSREILGTLPPRTSPELTPEAEKRQTAYFEKAIFLYKRKGGSTTQQHHNIQDRYGPQRLLFVFAEVTKREAKHQLLTDQVTIRGASSDARFSADQDVLTIKKMSLNLAHKKTMRA